MERTYIVPLKDYFLKTVNYNRTKKAVAGLKEFMQRHTKKDEILVSRLLNEALWKNGIKNPPRKIKVKVIIEDDKAMVRLFDEPAPKVEDKKKSKVEELTEQVEKTKSEAVTNKDVKDEVKVESARAEKDEVKKEEVKKEGKLTQNSKADTKKTEPKAKSSKAKSDSKKE